MIPNIKWSQTKEIIRMTLDIELVEKFSIENNNNEIKCVFIKEGKEESFDLSLYDSVKECSYYSNKNINLVLVKENNEWWNKLTKNNDFKHKIKIDWDRWIDEDDIDQDELNDLHGGMDMAQMMQMMSSQNIEDIPEGDDEEDTQEFKNDKICKKCT